MAETNETWVLRDAKLFDDYTARALGTGKPVIIYLYGDWKEGTQDSWCPDCVKADPIIRKAAKEHNTTLIEIPVGTREEYKNQPENQWRVCAKTSIKSVPTLLKWGIGGEKARLEEDDDCADAAKVKQLFEAK